MPKLLLGLHYFADRYHLFTSFINLIQADFVCQPDYTHCHLLFLSTGDPMIPLVIADIKLLLSQAIIVATVEDCPPMKATIMGDYPPSTQLSPIP
jgi:hypothetical protein